MSSTTSYPQVLRLFALLTAVVLLSWGTAFSPADAVEHGNTHKTTKSNSGNGATNSNSAFTADKTNNGHSKDTSSSESASSSAGAGQAQQGSSAAATGQSGGGVEQSQTAGKSTGKSTATSGGTSGGKGDPSGNNGTVKLAGFAESGGAANGPGHSTGAGSTAMHPSNDPHLPCTFSVEGFGFDEASLMSGGSFAQHAPTLAVNDQPNAIGLDGDPHTYGGSTGGYDGVMTYSYQWAGSAHPVHGYHIKLTAETPDATGGNDSKHKVFWVESCETGTPPGDNPGGDNPGGENPGCDTPGEEMPGDECNHPDCDNSGEGMPGDDCNPGEIPGGNTPGPPGGNTPGTPGGNTPGTPGGNTPGGNTSTVVHGAQASVPNSQGAQAAAQSAQSAGAQAAGQVPTAIESGLVGQGQQNQPLLPLLALLFGFGATVVALIRRKASD